MKINKNVPHRLQKLTGTFGAFRSPVSRRHGDPYYGHRDASKNDQILERLVKLSKFAIRIAFPSRFID